MHIIKVISFILPRTASACRGICPQRGRGRRGSTHSNTEAPGGSARILGRPEEYQSCQFDDRYPLSSAHDAIQISPSRVLLSWDFPERPSRRRIKPPPEHSPRTFLLSS